MRDKNVTYNDSWSIIVRAHASSCHSGIGYYLGADLMGVYLAYRNLQYSTGNLKHNNVDFAITIAHHTS